MKLKIALSILLSVISVSLFAQSSDSLFVTAKDGRWTIAHTVTKGETLFFIARRYHVPPAILGDANNLTYESKLVEKTIVTVPLEGYNLLKKADAQMGDARKLYHKTLPGESVALLSRLSGVPMKSLQEWNSLEGYRVDPGRTLFVGWVLYDATQMVKPEKTTQPDNTDRTVSKGGIVVVQEAPHSIPVTTVTKAEEPAEVVPVISETEKTYMQQTDSGANVVTEKGPAVFFDAATHSKIYYAFYNGAPRNAVIKVHNPGNGSTIYVKVLGSLPATKLYHGSIIGISSSARAALGAKENKVWCELTHAEP